MKDDRRRLLTALLALIPAIHVVVLVPALWRSADQPRDFAAYTWAAERLRDESALYQPVPPGPHVPGEGAPYLYPPFLAAITALVPLSGVTLSRFALFAGFVCFWVYAACLARVAHLRIRLYGVLLWGALLTAAVAPLGAVWVGQIDSLIWALFGVGLAFPALRGFGFAAAAFTKPFAVWPLGLALWRERKPVALGAVAAILAALVLSAVSVGLVPLTTLSLVWLSDVYPALSQGQFEYRVASVSESGTINRLVGFLGTGNISLGFLPLLLAHAAGWEFAGPELPVWARVYLTFAGLAGPAAAIWLTRHRSTPFRYAAVMCAAVAFGPIFRATYAPIFFALAAAWVGERRVRSHGSTP